MRRFDVDAGVREGVSTGELEELRRARKAVTAVQLAEALEVSPRTIYRDVSALMAMRTPIDGAASVGYLMRPGYDLPPLMIDREEVEAVAVGLQLLNRTGAQDLQGCRATRTGKAGDPVSLRHTGHPQAFSERRWQPNPYLQSSPACSRTVRTISPDSLKSLRPNRSKSGRMLLASPARLAASSTPATPVTASPCARA